MGGGNLTAACTKVSAPFQVYSFITSSMFWQNPDLLPAQAESRNKTWRFLNRKIYSTRTSSRHVCTLNALLEINSESSQNSQDELLNHGEIYSIIAQRIISERIVTVIRSRHRATISSLGVTVKPHEGFITRFIYGYNKKK